MPIYRRVWSVQTLFLLLITGVGLFLALFLLWAGAGIMNSIISQYGTELMQEKLHSLIQPVDLRYASLKRIGLEDSQIHRDEIQNTALKEFAAFRYKNTGSLFVISRNRSIILSQDFHSTLESGFNAFFSAFKTKSGTMEYLADGRDRFAVYQFYPPWNSYIGLSIDDRNSLPRNASSSGSASCWSRACCWQPSCSPVLFSA